MYLYIKKVLASNLYSYSDSGKGKGEWGIGGSGNQKQMHSSQFDAIAVNYRALDERESAKKCAFVAVSIDKDGQGPFQLTLALPGK